VKAANPSTDVPDSPIALSRLVLGTMTFGDSVDETTAARILDVALDAGITAVDTANIYNGGATEQLLGRLLPGRRERITLATKAGIPHPDAGSHPPLSAGGLRTALHGSLRRLGVEQVDLFYLHQPDRATPLAETLSTVAGLVSDGKIKALGVSNYAAWQISELNHAADRAGTPRPVIAQQLYNLIARRVEEEYLEFASTTNLATMVYNPLGGGLLTGRHTFAHRPVTGRFGNSPLATTYTERYWDPRLFAAIDQLSSIADGAGLSLVDLSLRWLISQRDVTAILIGGSTIEQVLANIRAASAGPLPADVLTACDAVGTDLRGPMPAYNR
jgi:aryl-alcohol dehydrogenase-like predicted oxidoreductase